MRKPAAIRTRRGRLLPLVALVLMVLLGLFLGQAGQTVLPPGPGYQIAAGAAIIVAIVLLIVRIARRR